MKSYRALHAEIGYLKSEGPWPLRRPLLPAVRFASGRDSDLIGTLIRRLMLSIVRTTTPLLRLIIQIVKILNLRLVIRFLPARLMIKNYCTVIRLSSSKRLKQCLPISNSNNGATKLVLV